MDAGRDRGAGRPSTEIAQQSQVVIDAYLGRPADMSAPRRQRRRCRLRQGGDPARRLASRRATARSPASSGRTAAGRARCSGAIAGRCRCVGGRGRSSTARRSTGRPSACVLQQRAGADAAGRRRLPALPCARTCAWAATRWPTAGARAADRASCSREFPSLARAPSVWPGISQRRRADDAGDRPRADRRTALHPVRRTFRRPVAELAAEALERVAAWPERGVGVLMVEQNIREAMRVADRIYSSRRTQPLRRIGRRTSSGQQLMELYLGASAEGRSTTNKEGDST